ncbi:MAG: IclR family transcriptional regulator C-terminal domain-containing protein, partial [Caldimonas sp.]
IASKRVTTNMDDPSVTVERKDLIEGLGKGLRLIEAFDDVHQRMTPSEAAVLTGMSRTAARRFLLSLVHFGYAGTDGKSFWLLPRVLRLGQSYLGAARMPRLVQPFIQRVSMQSGETVNFSILDGHEVVYLARSSAPRFVSIGYQVGVRVPAHVVAPGRVILSTRTDEAIDRWIEDHDFASFTAHTVTDPQQFRSEVTASRALGHWVTMQSLDLSLAGVAIAIKDRKGECKGAIGMTVQATTLADASRVEALLACLREAEQALRNVL